MSKRLRESKKQTKKPSQSKLFSKIEQGQKLSPRKRSEKEIKDDTSEGNFHNIVKKNILFTLKVNVRNFLLNIKSKRKEFFTENYFTILVFKILFSNFNSIKRKRY